MKISKGKETVVRIHIEGKDAEPPPSPPLLPLQMLLSRIGIRFFDNSCASAQSAVYNRVSFSPNKSLTLSKQLTEPDKGNSTRGGRGLRRANQTSPDRHRNSIYHYRAKYDSRFNIPSRVLASDETSRLASARRRQSKR